MIRTGDTLITFTVTSTMLILVVCRTPATYELSYMTMFFISCRSSVDKAPARYSGAEVICSIPVGSQILLFVC